MSKERYTEHTFAWELPNGDSVTKSNYNLADIETKYIPIQTEIISDNKDKTIAKLQQQISELEEELKNAIVPKFEVGQTLFRMDFGSIIPFLVNEIYGHIKADKTISIQYFDYVGLVIEENELFATREEAEQKLGELQGEKK